MSKQLPLPVVWGECTVKVIDDSTEKLQWITLGNCPYTPAHIQRTLKKAKVTSGWVFFLGGREFWMVGNGRLAYQP